MSRLEKAVSDSDRIEDIKASYFALIRSLCESVEHASKIISEAFHHLAQFGFSGGLFRRLKYLRRMEYYKKYRRRRRNSPTHRKRRMRRRLKHGTD
jgi:hypothetical protein